MALIACLRRLPQSLRQTLTVDEGSGMAGFRELESATGVRTHFCRPHSPWQRGTNENGNGLLRQYFPRGISFHRITEGMLRNAAERLNGQPRTCYATRPWLRFLIMPSVARLQVEFTAEAGLI